jgi:hypothetical protein
MKRIVIGILAVLAGCTASESPETSESGASQSATDTEAMFSPKISLDRLRFVYHWETGLFMELKDEQAALLDEFLITFPDVGPDTHAPFLKDEERLTTDQQQFLAERIPEKIGGRYCVYFPDQTSAALYQLSEYALKPTGDGGFRGFLGKLTPTAGPVAEVEAPSQGEWPGLTAVAFLSNTTPSKPAPVSEPVTDTATLESIRMKLDKVKELRNQDLYECSKFYLSYPDSVGYLAKVHGEIGWTESGEASLQREISHPSYLFCLARVENGYRLVPFPQDSMFPAEPFGGLMIEVSDYPGANDLSPGNTKVYVLPDLDGDGSSEMLIDTTVMQLFRFMKKENELNLSAEWAIELVMESYFGP